MSLALHLPRLQRLGFLCETVRPEALSRPELPVFSSELAAELGIPDSVFVQADTVAQLSGSAARYDPAPIATVYSGHQFGVYVPQLGDGRAMLLGDLAAPDGSRWEIQLKGSGKTPFSRFADGRAVLRSTIREYLASEAMHALGIPTTRALAITVSPDPVYREQPETAAVLTRAAPSFLRFGHFEYFYHRRQHQHLAPLADYLIAEHYPECRTAENPHLALFETVTRRTAALIAQWQAVGFCHGVMNTDNMSLLGLTIDYGPYGFLDGFNRHHVCNHSDAGGRYAYKEQPYVAQWNLLKLGSAFLPLAAEAELIAVIESFVGHYQTGYLNAMRQKLGLSHSQPDDAELVHDLLDVLQQAEADYTLFFRRLAEMPAEHQAPLPDSLLRLFPHAERLIHWSGRYKRRLRQENLPPAERKRQMDAVNPLYVPRNYLLEQAIAQARDHGDFDGVRRLKACWQDPFTERTEYADLADTPPDWAADICISCSS
ncbi:protein adenylyltransferase SelO [Neisseria shayeganii]|uniref:Protein nucleotidyltransferase YdiU n=1 Tax=Neisseria shayeganii TaxID=607712 RepID=A0A7D7NAR3_9NEIS|nr:YdiU family protein [Neisseria shayeganii]QMT40939.1 YdiU family protein [Neisseria shayeganii]